MSEIKNINISTKIYEKIEEKIKDPLVGCENVEEYIKLILEKALDIDSEESEVSKTEEEKVEEAAEDIEEVAVESWTSTVLTFTIISHRSKYLSSITFVRTLVLPFLSLPSLSLSLSVRDTSTLLNLLSS